MLTRVFQKLTDAGINCKMVKMCDRTEAIMCSTDYEGLYPTKEVFTLHDRIKKLIKRYNVTAEARGCYTGLLIKVK